MQNIIRLSCLLALVSFSAVEARSADPTYFAVLNAKNPTRAVREGDIRAIFMGSTSFWNGVVPIKLVARPETSVGAGFFERVLGTTQQRFQQHWTSRQLAGMGTSPEVVDDVTALCGRVRTSPGAISVIAADEADAARAQAGVKLLPIQ